MRWEKPPCSPPKHGLDLRKEKCLGGHGGCLCGALPASLLGTGTGPCRGFPQLLCSQGLLRRAAVTPCAAVCTTKPIASLVEAFNDSGAGSSPGDGFHCLQNSSLGGCFVAEIPRGAELMLAPQEMCYQEVRSLLYFHSDHPHLWGLELN